MLAAALHSTATKALTCEFSRGGRRHGLAEEMQRTVVQALLCPEYAAHAGYTLAPSLMDGQH